MKVQQSLWRNLIVNVDSYKCTHHAMYPEGTEYVSSYIESRAGRYPVTMFVGLQAFLLEYLMHPLTVEDVQEAEAVHHAMNVPFERQNWLDLIRDHDGYLPLEIEAVPEGTVLPTRNVLVQVVNTDPKYYWLPSFIETALLRAIWYPTSVGTTSWVAKQHLRGFFERTADNFELFRHYLHDYGARGVSSYESASLGGLAHLVNFDASDTVPAYVAARQYYNASTAPGGSGPFQEHTHTIACGRDGEAETFRKLLTNPSFGVAGLLLDTYDHENAVRNILGKELRDEVLNYPGLVAVRCDSGDPVKVSADTIEWLMEDFGSTVNSKGFRRLPPNILAVQGDGLTPASHREVYTELERRGLSAENLICGMGGGLLQRVNRDTLNFGQKTNSIRVNGTWRDVQKKPAEDTMKWSKAGRLALKYNGEDYETVARDSIAPEENVLVPVFRDGKLLKMWDFEELKARSERPTPAYYYRDADEPVAAL